MNIYFIRLDDAAYEVLGDKMFLDGAYLYVYACEDLRGMFLAAKVLDARLAKSRKEVAN